jgi:hypothetical protein
MSEYQYYEFQAVDRLLDAKAMTQLRKISSRARITPSSFVNSYNWGDLKADPLELLARHFDLFLYFANWGTRQFAMKLPRRLLNDGLRKLRESERDVLLVQPAGEHVILSIQRNELCDEYLDADDESDDDSGWLQWLAPLRAEILAEDLRLLPLLWLIEVQEETIDDAALEPSPGLRSLSPALAKLAEFLCIDGDLLEAACGSAIPETPAKPPAGTVEQFLRELAEEEKVRLLLHLHDGNDPHLGLELQQRVRLAVAPPVIPPGPPRTAGDLRAAAIRIAEAREQRAKARAAAEQRRREREAAQAQAKRIAALTGREQQAWSEAESLIALRNPKGYDQATALIVDLGALADRDGRFETFAQRIAELRARHATKSKFIERLDRAGVPRATALRL